MAKQQSKTITTIIGCKVQKYIIKKEKQDIEQIFLRKMGRKQAYLKQEIIMNIVYSVDTRTVFTEKRQQKVGRLNREREL